MRDRPNQPPDDDTAKLPPDASVVIGGWMIVLLWLLVLGGGSLLANQWIKGQEAAKLTVWTAADGITPKLTLRADRYGQYQLTGSANGQNVKFLLDTGATGIGIPVKVANRLNLIRGRSFPVSTANGQVTVYSTQLDEVSIGPFTLENVPAHINPGINGNVALLGMSFLRHFEMIQRSGEMTISAP
ncbi:MAG: aspartyl protease family protein [bacterium]|jgi:aspartyl protease family protein